MTELISRSQSAKARWAVRSAHDVSDAKRLKVLEEENARLKRLLAEA
ncbi:hypothetical protein GOB04_29855, partial [Sinorhizobium meliloti]|nr:hypothetical protein [Sinorhizobium meliloti]